MHVTLNAFTEMGNTIGTTASKIQGTLVFEKADKIMTVEYFFAPNTPSKSLQQGDEIDITFKIEDELFPIKGIYPDVLETVPDRAKILWSLAHGLILNNVYIIYAGTDGKATDIKGAKQNMSGQIPDENSQILFGE